MNHNWATCEAAPCVLCQKLSKAITDYARVLRTHARGEVPEAALTRLFLLGYAADVVAGDVQMDDLTAVIEQEQTDGRLLTLLVSRARMLVWGYVQEAGGVTTDPAPGNKRGVDGRAKDGDPLRARPPVPGLAGLTFSPRETT